MVRSKLMNPKINGNIEKYHGTIWCEYNDFYLLAQIGPCSYNFIYLGTSACYKRLPFSYGEDLDDYIFRRNMKYIGTTKELDLESFRAEKDECNSSR